MSEELEKIVAMPDGEELLDIKFLVRPTERASKDSVVHQVADVVSARRNGQIATECTSEELVSSVSLAGFIPGYH